MFLQWFRCDSCLLALSWSQQKEPVANSSQFSVLNHQFKLNLPMAILSGHFKGITKMCQFQNVAFINSLCWNVAINSNIWNTKTLADIFFFEHMQLTESISFGRHAMIHCHWLVPVPMQRLKVNCWWLCSCAGFHFKNKY